MGRGRERGGRPGDGVDKIGGFHHRETVHVVQHGNLHLYAHINAIMQHAGVRTHHLPKQSMDVHTGAHLIKRTWEFQIRHQEKQEKKEEEEVTEEGDEDEDDQQEDKEEGGGDEMIMTKMKLEKNEEEEKEKMKMKIIKRRGRKGGRRC